MATNPTTITPKAPAGPPQNFRDLIPPERYQGLRSGPAMTFEMEENKAQPLDGSNSLLRTLSPFIIQVEPPLVIGSEPALINPTAKGARVTGLYQAGLKARGGFTNARAALAMTTYVNGNFGPGTADEVLSRNSGVRSSGGTRNPNGDGTKKTDSTGQMAQGKIGEPAVADLRVAVDIATQLKTIYTTPPLVLLINPASLSIAYNKIQAYQDRSRFGYIFQAWGEDQPKLSISAKCGAFISGGRGVQWASRRDSASWQNLMTAFQFYQNNGYIYDTVGKSNAHHLVGALSIRYDQWIYFGSMQTLSYNLEDSSTMHGGVTFEMEFVVSAMVDTTSTFPSSYQPSPNTASPESQASSNSQASPAATPVSSTDPVAQKPSDESGPPANAKPNRPTDPSLRKKSTSGSKTTQQKATEQKGTSPSAAPAPPPKPTDVLPTLQSSPTAGIPWKATSSGWLEATPADGSNYRDVFESGSGGH